MESKSVLWLEPPLSRRLRSLSLLDIGCADEFGMAVAIAKGTPEHPLREPEDLYEARIVSASRGASDLGIDRGMTGLETLEKLMAHE